MKSTCPFSRRVIAVVERLDLECEMKDIEENAAFADELEAKGGKVQVPYLVDDAAGVAMYESDDIVAYLQSNYGTPTIATRPRIHVSSGSACLSCEG